MIPAASPNPASSKAVPDPLKRLELAEQVDHQLSLTGAFPPDRLYYQSLSEGPASPVTRIACSFRSIRIALGNKGRAKIGNLQGTGEADINFATPDIPQGEIRR